MKVKDNKQIATWLYFGAGTIIIQILLGGITRLTGSGLSITEWQPLLGTIPPLNQSAWQTSFDKYKEIAQFHIVNSHFTLEDYKSIFFWEWLHRNWARFIGIAFLFPLIYFLIRKKIEKKLLFSLLFLFILGLLQAIIGWIMVKSGLNDINIKVNHIRLSIHFVAALILLCYTLWLAFSLSLQPIKMRHRLRFPKLNILILILVTLQMIYGAFMAGTNAALAAITWPDMNGFAIPPQISFQKMNLIRMTNDLLTIQFIHRTLAYVICILVLTLYIKSSTWKINSTLSFIRLSPLLLVVTQCIIGITTILNSINGHYKSFALLHQFTGILLLISLLLFLFLNLKKT
ncbi:heme A synthase [Pedobacter hiemivivus]|uniref:Heme A synthase n=2 Tax=Pedobacter hiemivivus TaxID=2530454 RepID=A0A4U1FW71_9SPHI|nr:COX15/CtaA family protein [Pedobacter hiemivivus]TKC54804.1 heme A synthase [Pedobacter hiemivivus]